MVHFPFVQSIVYMLLLVAAYVFWFFQFLSVDFVCAKAIRAGRHDQQHRASVKCDCRTETSELTDAPVAVSFRW